MFVNREIGQLVAINGEDRLLGRWTHSAFVAAALPAEPPTLQPTTYFAIADARAALANLDSTARQLPNPRLFRLPALRREAQSTSELEGTYATLSEVLTADENAPATTELREILNYVVMADYGFQRIEEGRAITTGLLEELQGILMRGTSLEQGSGKLRSTQVVIGRRPEASPEDFPIVASRFVPAPPGIYLEGGVASLLEWLASPAVTQLDPVLAAAMAHYQFETLHPFTDGNGRLGRYLVVLQLLRSKTLSEPTLTVSPWFESRRREYYDHLLRVSTDGDWDSYVRFFANGLTHAAMSTQSELLRLAQVQESLHETVRNSRLRADTAHSVVDIAVANPTFTVAKVQTELGVSYPRALKLVNQLCELGIIQALDPNAYQRRYFAPMVLEVLTQQRDL